MKVNVRAVVVMRRKTAIDPISPAPGPHGDEEHGDADDEVRHCKPHQYARDSPVLPLVAVVLEQAQP